jgi:16S rRNA (guanine(966)-N(2))-methyltransferase RsmD
LDLFAGTGSISYEFASRGSQFIVAVDSHPRCIRFIKETSERLDFASIKVIRANAFTFLRQTRQQFDIIFADPPYETEGIEQIVAIVSEKELLKQDGWLIIEHPKEVDFSEYEKFFNRRKYGRVNFSFFK